MGNYEKGRQWVWAMRAHGNDVAATTAELAAMFAYGHDTEFFRGAEEALNEWEDVENEQN